MTLSLAESRARHADRERARRARMTTAEREAYREAQRNARYLRQYGITGRRTTNTGGATSADIGAEWGGNNTGSMDSKSADGKTYRDGSTDDEQVMTVVASYKMNQ